MFSTIGVGIHKQQTLSSQQQYGTVWSSLVCDINFVGNKKLKKKTFIIKHCKRIILIQTHRQNAHFVSTFASSIGREFTKLCSLNKHLGNFNKGRQFLAFLVFYFRYSIPIPFECASTYSNEHFDRLFFFFLFLISIVEFWLQFSNFYGVWLANWTQTRRTANTKKNFRFIFRFVCKESFQLTFK